MVSTYKAALTSLWSGLCNVYVREYTRNAITGRSEPTEVLKLDNEPCRVSFSSITSTGEKDDAPTIQQTVKLFISSAVDIPEGSKIVVTQNGQTEAYTRSGAPAVYTYHQEIMLVPFEEYA